MRGWITPDSLPTTYECRVIPIPVTAGDNAASWLSIIRGALLSLTTADHFEQIEGITTDDTANVFANVFNKFCEGVMAYPVGSIVSFAGDTAPEGWIIADGSMVLQSEFPDLYAVLGTTFGPAVGGYFTLPNLSARFPLGKSGSYPLGAIGGETSHTLTTAELPPHHHAQKFNTQAVASGTGETPHKLNASGAYNVNTGDTGSGNAHNNMPPYTALNFIIFAGCVP